MDVTAASGADQLALAPLKIAHDQQDKNGELALALIESAVPATAEVASPATYSGSKGGFVDTFA